MQTRFNNTDDFNIRYKNFIKDLAQINQQYRSFFKLKEDETGQPDSIEMHVTIIRINDENGNVRIRIPRSYFPKAIKDDVIKIFAAHFNPDFVSS